MMITMRPEQMEELTTESPEEFADRTIPHVQEEFPDECEALGPDGTRNVILFGVERAGEYGITDDECLTLYIDLMFALGFEFDRDPSLPWAADILTDDDRSEEETIYGLVTRAALEQSSAQDVADSEPSMH